MNTRKTKRKAPSSKDEKKAKKKPKVEEKKKAYVPITWPCEYKGCKVTATTLDSDKAKWFCSSHYKMKCKECKKVSVNVEGGRCLLCGLRHLKNVQCGICLCVDEEITTLKNENYCEDCLPGCDWYDCSNPARTTSGGKAVCHECASEMKDEDKAEKLQCERDECEVWAERSKMIKRESEAGMLLYCSQECIDLVEEDTCDCDEEEGHGMKCNLNNEWRVKLGRKPICAACHDKEEETTQVQDDEWFCSICMPKCRFKGCTDKAVTLVDGDYRCKEHEDSLKCCEWLCMGVGDRETDIAGVKICCDCYYTDKYHLCHQCSTVTARKVGPGTNFYCFKCIPKCSQCGVVATVSLGKWYCLDCKPTCCVAYCKDKAEDYKNGICLCKHHAEFKAKICKKCVIRNVEFRTLEEEKTKESCNACTKEVEEAKKTKCELPGCTGEDHRVRLVGDKWLCFGHQPYYSQFTGKEFKCASLDCHGEAEYRVGAEVYCSTKCTSHSYPLNKTQCEKCSQTSVVGDCKCEAAVHCWRCCVDSRVDARNQLESIHQLRKTVKELI